MKKVFIFSLLAVFALASCTKEIPAPENEQSTEYSGKMKTITVVTNLDTKTTLDSNHERLQWSAGDAVSLFNNKDNTNTELTYSAGDMTVSVPAATTEIYCHYPYFSGNTSGPSSVSVYISNAQTQTNPGELNGYFYPMVAKGTITDDKAIVSFYPVASALALNIYHTGLIGTEKVYSVKVTPTANTNFIKQQIMNLTGDGLVYSSASASNPITVTLTNPLTLGSTKPVDSQKFDGQIYVCLARQSYTSVKFEITTDKGVYTITSNSAAINCTNKDFVPVNINLNKAVFETDYVTLNWTYPTGASAATSAGINAINGVSTYGLGSDYGDSHSPYLIKFDNTGDYIQVKTNTSINTVSVKYKMIGGGTTSTLNIKESEDGSAWTNVENLSISGSQNSTGTLTTSTAFKTGSRYVQIYFTKGSNVGIGGITITKSNVDPTIDDASVDAASARGGAGLTKDISLSNYVSAPSLTATPDGAVVTTATVDNVTTTGATVTYTLAPNYTGAAAVGTITISDGGSASGTITVNQVADVFTVSRTSIELNANSGATATFTVKSDFDWTIDDSSLSGFTVSPNSFTYTDKQSQTVTVTATGNNTTSSPVDLDIFCVTRTADSKDSDVITVTQKSAKLATPSVTLIGDGANKKFTASWDAIEHATQYVYYVLDEDVNEIVAETVTTSTSVEISSLNTGIEYTFFVKAQGDSPYIDSDEGSDSVTLTAGKPLQTVSVTMADYATDNSWVTSSGNNVTCYTSVSLDSYVTMSVNSSGNNGSYWTDGWRVYHSANAVITLSVPAGYTLVSAKFTYTVANNGKLTNDQASAVMTSGTAVTISGTSATFTVGNTNSKTNGQVKITAVEVQYK